jgi:hypothetical protein
MAIEIHKKGAAITPTYRVWSTVTDTYESDELTEDQLREYLFQRHVERAITDAWTSFQWKRRPPVVTKVRGWKKERNHEKADTGLLEQRYRQLIGGDIPFEFSTDSVGKKIITVTIVPIG